MWLKYVNRSLDSLRVFRKTNLKFNQDDIGLLSFKVISPAKDLLFRMSRAEGVLRGGLLFSLAGIIGAVAYAKEELTRNSEIEKKRNKEAQEARLNKQARQKLFYNQFNIPTHPTRSTENFMVFLQSPAALNDIFKFMAFGLDVNADQVAGLDSSTSQSDEIMLDLLQQSKRRKGSH